MSTVGPFPEYYRFIQKSPKMDSYEIIILKQKTGGWRLFDTV